MTQKIDVEPKKVKTCLINRIPQIKQDCVKISLINYDQVKLVYYQIIVKQLYNFYYQPIIQI